MAGDTIQMGTITWAVNADSAIPFQALPVPPFLVSLAVRDAMGTAYPVTPVPGKPGLYQVVLAVIRGASYSLEGTLDGTAVHAVTNIPDSAALVEPAADTLLPPPGYDYFLRYRFASARVAGFSVVVLDTIVRAFPRFLPQPAGETLVSRSRPDSSNASVRFLAYNEDAADWLQYGTPAGNIAGAAGAFGGAIGIRRVLIWP